MFDVVRELTKALLFGLLNYDFGWPRGRRLHNWLRLGRSGLGHRLWLGLSFNSLDRDSPLLLGFWFGGAHIDYVASQEAGPVVVVFAILLT